MQPGGVGWGGGLVMGGETAEIETFISCLHQALTRTLDASHSLFLLRRGSSEFIILLLLCETWLYKYHGSRIMTNDITLHTFAFLLSL